MFKTNIHLFAPLHLCVFALNFQLTFGINRVDSYPAGAADPANPVKFYVFVMLSLALEATSLAFHLDFVLALVLSLLKVLSCLKLLVEIRPVCHYPWQI
jgi:hypothetical protein